MVSHHTTACEVHNSALKFLFIHYCKQQKLILVNAWHAETFLSSRRRGQGMKGWENRHDKMKRENFYEMELKTALLVPSRALQE